MHKLKRLITSIAQAVAASICPQARAWRKAGIELGPRCEGCVRDTSGRGLIVLACDGTDFQAIQRVMALRERELPIPDGGSNANGAVIAEICRGYEEMLAAAGPEPKPWKNE